MSDTSKFENIIIDKTDHLHQTDLNIVAFFELEFILTRLYKGNGTLHFKDEREGIIPPIKKSQLCQFFIYLQLRFLNKHGFQSNNGMDMEVINERLKLFDDAQKGQLGYIYNPASEFKI